jgi:hypothetical protein
VAKTKPRNGLIKLGFKKRLAMQPAVTLFVFSISYYCHCGSLICFLLSDIHFTYGFACTLTLFTAAYKWKLKACLLTTMDSFLFRRFKDSLDEPQSYEKEGTHILLRKERATIPVILSAPHGGGDKHFPTGTHSMKPRLPGGKNVSMKSDLYTLQMIASIDKCIFDLSGQYCYVVAATVHRRYVDCNRNSKESEANTHNPECIESEAYYDAYHSNCSGHPTARLEENGQPSTPHAL